MLQLQEKMGKIGEWKASYFSNDTKAWKYGLFIIYTPAIRFVEDNESTNRADIRIFFEDFFELKKETTSLFFGAITVRVRGDKYWFSSFADRGNVFTTIEHFWKERLFASSAGKAAKKNECFQVLHDAQETLTLAGRTVQKQGQQITAACANMNKIHNDLAVADTFIHNLDAWFIKWKITVPQAQIKVPEHSIIIIEKSEFPIVYAKIQRAKHFPGSLVLSTEKLDILTSCNDLDISFSVREVTEVNVHTPWEATIAKSQIGQAAQTVHLIAARLMNILQKLAVLLPGKINYDEPPCDIGDDEMDYGEMENSDHGAGASGSEQFEAMNSKGRKTETMSDAAAAEMGQVLQDMRSMALGIQREQDRQLHQLDQLSSSVNKAREIMKSDDRKIKSLQ